MYLEIKTYHWFCYILYRNDNLSEQYSTLKKEKEILVKSKENAELQIVELTRTLHGTELKIESLTKDLTR